MGCNLSYLVSEEISFELFENLSNEEIAKEISFELFENIINEEITKNEHDDDKFYSIQQYSANYFIENSYNIDQNQPNQLNFQLRNDQYNPRISLQLQENQNINHIQENPENFIQMPMNYHSNDSAFYQQNSTINTQQPQNQQYYKLHSFSNDISNIQLQIKKTIVQSLDSSDQQFV